MRSENDFEETGSSSTPLKKATSVESFNNLYKKRKNDSLNLTNSEYCTLRLNRTGACKNDEVRRTSCNDMVRDDDLTLRSNNKRKMENEDLIDLSFCSKEDEHEIIEIGECDGAGISSYCTIRRENKTDKNNSLPYCTLSRSKTQKNIPLLNNCKLPHHQSENTVEAFNILSQLDEILDNHEKSIPVPIKVEDCLYDLDQYLEEIDKNDKDKLIQDDSNKVTFKRDSLFRMSLNPGKNSFHFCTLPKRRRKENNVLDTKFLIKNEKLYRGSPSRNTINVAGRRRKFEDAEKRNDSEPKRRSSWLRNSMRKTRPILLPDHPSTSHESTNRQNILTPAVEEICSPLTTNTTTTNNFINNHDLNEEILNIENSLTLRNADVSNTTLQEPFEQFPGFILNPEYQGQETDPELFGRPRQMGRRSEIRPRLVAITTETDTLGAQRITMSHDRPVSAPARTPSIRTTPRRYMSSEASSVVSSRNPSPVSLVSSTGSSSIASAVDNNERPRQRPIDPEETVTEEPDDRRKKTKWPHKFGKCFATSCCTLGLFNISRFAIFSVHFGANFIVQFLIFSVIFGIPMLWLQMCLGAKIKNGPISMWRISPICKGIGISLLLAQGFLGLYSTISLGWVLIYFRDSFVSRSLKYRWEEIFELYRGSTNESINLSETVADYFNGVVLQRYHLGAGGRVGYQGIGSVRFQVAFNLAILWSVVFVILCKGLRSYGKMVVGLSVLPLIGLTALVAKFITLIDMSSLQSVFPSTDWQDFFPNSQSWLSAAQETFLTWNLLGVSVLAMNSKPSEKKINKTALRRDAIITVFITLYGLILAAILGNACVQILFDRGYWYLPGSYESLDTYGFLLPRNAPLPPRIASYPSKWYPRYSTVLGEMTRKPGINPGKESGYQVLRLITELFPASLAAATQERIGPVWCIFGYLTFLTFGISQLCAMWKPLSNVLGNSPSSVLLSCVLALLLGIPLTTESGINIIQFLDVVLGGAWWIYLLWIAYIIAIFLVRGRPFSSDILVNDLRMTQTLSAFLAFSWNVLIPIGMMMISILQYKASNARDLFYWRAIKYWPLWVRQIGGFMQVFFLLLVPVISMIQIYRYLSRGPPDILDRIQLLYRPSLDGRPHRNLPSPRRSEIQTQTQGITTIPLDLPGPMDDAPPKYTPPPSYTTATGARIAKMLRQSIRRSVRRILGESSLSRRQRPSLQQTTNDLLTPPEYTTVYSDPNGDNVEIGPRIIYNSQTTGKENQTSVPPERTPTTFSACDVATLLRSTRTPNSFHRTASLSSAVDLAMRSTFQLNQHSRSVENLVLNAEPLGESSVITLNDVSSADNTSVI